MLTSSRNPRVKDVVKLRSRRHRDREQRFVIEGSRELACAADAGVAFEALYFCDELIAGRDGRSLVDRVCESVPYCQPTSRGVFEKMSYRRTPDGVLAVAPMPTLELGGLPIADPALWLIAVAIEKPGNLGAMLRSADASGATGVVVADPTTDLFNPNVVRASMGTLFTVPVAVATAADVRGWLESRQIRAFAAHPDARLEYTEIDLRGAVAIVVGSEHSGLDAEWSASGYQVVRIPMYGRADSINAAMAATVLLYEARRQRRRDRGTPD